MGDLPLPRRDNFPKFIAQEGWLEEKVTQIMEESKISEIPTTFKRRKRPFCVARGGKTRALKELAHELRARGVPVIFVTFNSWSTLGNSSSEQDDPLQALLIRMAFKR